MPRHRELLFAKFTFFICKSPFRLGPFEIISIESVLLINIRAVYPGSELPHDMTIAMSSAASLLFQMPPILEL